MTRSIAGAESEALVRAVEALYAGDGPPPRATQIVRGPDGAERIRAGRLFLECAICGTRQPQSGSRQAPEARQIWVAFHLRCTENPE